MKKLLIIPILLALLTVFFWPKFSLTSPLSSFKPEISNTPTPTPKPSQAIIGLAGDLGLGRHITSTARLKNDFTWSFGGVASWLQQNDLNIANLESPVTDPCPEGLTGTFTFCGDKRFLPQLSQNKFILTLANNHILNYGQSGLKQTYDFLNQYQIPFYYSHQDDYKFTTQTIDNISFGFLGYDLVTYPPNIANNIAQSELIEQIISDISQYNNQVDWLVISLHWGNEYLPQAETWRVNLVHRLIDAGADIIHGHHPHVIQPSEIYKDKPIFYSLGNFIFDQSWSYETSHSQLIRLTLSQNSILDTTIIPIAIRNNSRPEIETLD